MNMTSLWRTLTTAATHGITAAAVLLGTRTMSSTPPPSVSPVVVRLSLQHLSPADRGELAEVLDRAITTEDLESGNVSRFARASALESCPAGEFHAWKLVALKILRGE